MTLTRLLRRNLFFHWRGNLAVLLGVAVGTAVLTGALLVGDSLRGSLRDRALRQIGWVDAVMVSGRFVRQELARDLAGPGATVAPVVALQGRARAGESSGPSVSVSILGIDWEAQDLFNREGERAYARMRDLPWPFNKIAKLISSPPLPYSHVGLSADVIGDVPFQVANAIPESLARGLGVSPGGMITLSIAKASDIPRETVFSRRGESETRGEVRIRVQWIYPDQNPAAGFSLQPSTTPLPPVYVRQEILQENLGLPGKVNAFLVEGGSVETLQNRLKDHLTLDDWGLVLHTPQSQTDALIRQYGRDNKLSPREWPGHVAEAVAQAADTDGDKTLTRDELLAYFRRRGYVSLESRQLLLEPAVERAALEVARDMRLEAGPTLVYLANTIGTPDDDPERSIPYSVVAALDPNQPPPLGPFIAPGSEPLADDEILLADWPESPLKVKPGDKVVLTYYAPEQEGRLQERSNLFRVRGLVPLRGVAADPGLTPTFPGITDKLGLRDWDPPFPYDNRRIKKRDEDYWQRYRATPKAYVNLAIGRQMFGSRFGELTSIRLAPPVSPDKPPNLEAIAQEFGKRLLAKLSPEQGGFVFEDVRARALAASTGASDFGLLFLGFSIFLIAAALVLVGLLVRLNLERRAGEVGLLLATGYRVGAVRRLLLVEGLILSLVGGALGLIGAVGYAALMLQLLAALWPSGQVGSFLALHVTWLSLVVGFVAALAVSALTIWWAVRLLNRVAPSALLAGVTVPETVAETAISPSPWRRRIIVGSVVLGPILLVAGVFVPSGEARAGTFFTGGLLLLTAALVAVWGWLRAPQHDTIHPGDPAALVRLGVRNAVRNPVRSLLTAALLASAAFLLVAVESFRRSPEADFLDKTGGSGGFALVAESDLPLYRDPASPEGRQDILDALEKVYQSDPATKQAKLDAAQKLLESTTIIPLRVKAGDDVSCLNLFQPERPRLLGVPRTLIERGGFRFASTMAKTAEERKNPWRLLLGGTEDGATPVFGENHTVTYVLKSGLGRTLDVTDEHGRPLKLRIVGLFEDSVFQSELVMADTQLLKFFPKIEGFSYFLIEPPFSNTEEVRSLLDSALADRGFVATPAKERLAAYLAVENTYLSTFQVLGGFGLLLGALGLAVVLLRGVWERRGELALLRALGYRRRALGGMVLAENAALLLLGLGAGVGSAALAVAPHVLTGEGAVPWARLAFLLGVVLAVGLAAGGAAVRSTLRAPLVPALRRE